MKQHLAIDRQRGLRPSASERPSPSEPASPAAERPTEPVRADTLLVRAQRLGHRVPLDPRVIRRARLNQVMLGKHHFSTTMAELKVHYARRHGIPPGYHVTIFPNLTPTQEREAVEDKSLAELTDSDSVEFSEFNVTREENRAHFYFDEHGNILWKKTKKEAGLESEHWKDAIDAALVIYQAIGVGVTKKELIQQLYTMGRRSVVDAAFEEPKVETPAPLSAQSRLMLIPPQVRQRMKEQAKRGTPTTLKPPSLPPAEKSTSSASATTSTATFGLYDDLPPPRSQQARTETVLEPKPPSLPPVEESTSSVSATTSTATTGLYDDLPPPRSAALPLPQTSSPSLYGNQPPPIMLPPPIGWRRGDRVRLSGGRVAGHTGTVEDPLEDRTEIVVRLDGLLKIDDVEVAFIITRKSDVARL